MGLTVQDPGRRRGKPQVAPLPQGLDPGCTAGTLWNADLLSVDAIGSAAGILLTLEGV